MLPKCINAPYERFAGLTPKLNGQFIKITTTDHLDHKPVSLSGQI